MLKKYVKLFLIGIMAIGMGSVHGQAIHITLNNGNHTEYALSNIQKLTFSGGAMQVVRSNHDVASFPLADLQLVHFTQEVTGVANSNNPLNRMLTAYPNPVSHMLTISLTGIHYENGSIALYSMDGRMIQRINISQQELLTIDMSHLPNGIYICRFHSNIEAKTIKIVKQ